MNELEGLLADMRRKYLHAKAMHTDGDWLSGNPITAQILESWIPIVERAVNAVQPKVTTIRENVTPRDVTGRTEPPDPPERDRLNGWLPRGYHMRGRG